MRYQTRKRGKKRRKNKGRMNEILKEKNSKWRIYGKWRKHRRRKESKEGDKNENENERESKEKKESKKKKKNEDKIREITKR